MKILLSVITIIICLSEMVYSFNPYVFEQTGREYSYGGYAVIDSTKNEVISIS